MVSSVIDYIFVTKYIIYNDKEFSSIKGNEYIIYGSVDLEVLAYTENITRRQPMTDVDPMEV